MSTDVFPSSLWVIVMVDSRGFPQEYKIRAPSQQDALDRIFKAKPFWSVGISPHGLPLIHREELLG